MPLIILAQPQFPLRRALPRARKSNPDIRRKSALADDKLTPDTPPMIRGVCFQSKRDNERRAKHCGCARCSRRSVYGRAVEHAGGHLDQPRTLRFADDRHARRIHRRKLVAMCHGRESHHRSLRASSRHRKKTRGPHIPCESTLRHRRKRRRTRSPRTLGARGETPLGSSADIARSARSPKSPRRRARADQTALSAFFDTSLDDDLRERNVNTVILAGTTTPNCIRTTCYDALSLNYDVVIVEDATSSRSSEVQKANIEDMRFIGAHITCSAELEGLLEG